MTLNNDIKHTALHDRHIALGARMGAFAGFEMPMWYAGIKAEHQAVREKVGIFDLSHMGEIYIKGREAFDFIQYLTCNDLRRIGDGQCQYTLFPTPEGGVVDDLIVYQINPEDYMLVVNASNISEDYQWLLKHNKYDCEVIDRSDELSLVAVQGPRTDDLLKKFGLKRIARQEAFTFRRTKLGGHRFTIAGTGYTGERGFELIIENKDALWLWDEIMSAGEEFGVVPVGLGARDTLRLEMAYSLYGHELSDEISVLEANLAWTTRLNTDFLGKEHLAQQLSNGVPRIIAGIEMKKSLGTPRNSSPVSTKTGEKIGYVTSGSFSPSLDKGIALVLIDPKHSEIGTPLLVDVRGKRAPAVICETPFYKKPKK